MINKACTAPAATVAPAAARPQRHQAFFLSMKQQASKFAFWRFSGSVRAVVMAPQQDVAIKDQNSFGRDLNPEASNGATFLCSVCLSHVS